MPALVFMRTQSARRLSTLPRQRTRPAGAHRAQLRSAFVSNLPTFATPRKRPASSPLILQVFASWRAHWSCAFLASSSVLPEKLFLRFLRPMLRCRGGVGCLFALCSVFASAFVPLVIVAVRA